MARVVPESSVVFREAGFDVVGVVYGLGAEEKFLKDASDMRGAFHGKRRITMQQ